MTLTHDNALAPLDAFAQAFEALDGHALNGTNSRLQRRRHASIAQVQALGLPTRRSEDWKYTRIERALDHPFALAAGPWNGTLDAADLDAARVPGLDAHTVVLVNGSFQEGHSRLGALPEGVIVMGLRTALAEHADLVDAHLDTYTRGDSEVFTALNTAFLTDGLFVYVPKGAALEKPIHLIHVFDAPRDVLVQPRVLVVAEENAQVTVVETARVRGKGRVFVNHVAEFSVGVRAHARHYRVQDEGPQTIEVTTLDAYQRRESTFSTTVATLSGDVVRNNVRILPDAEHCESHMQGLFLADGTMHVDNATFMDHAQPNCESKELYKGVLWDQAKGVFYGKVLVRPDAQKTNAYQSSRSIILGDDAEMYSKPELEIYADDVQCSHGAATGKLDPDALFYLRARGLDLNQARALMLLAFARDVTDTITLPALHDWLDEKLQMRFHAD